MVDNAQGTAADDPEVRQVRRDLVDLREQFAAASEVLVSLGQSSSNNDAVLDTLVWTVPGLVDTSGEDRSSRT